MSEPEKRLPTWLRNPINKNIPRKAIRTHLATGIHTVCESALCPNRGECFSQRTVTFMILGETCTRNCTFCAVDSNVKDVSLTVNPNEPEDVAQSAFNLQLKHVVITSVTRDDLPDEGASQFAKTIEAVRHRLPVSTIEVLTPDFNGKTHLLDTVLSKTPNIFNHNVETIPRLYPSIRPQADYLQSLKVLKYAKDAHGIITKSGFMLGLGETSSEVVQVLENLKEAGVSLVTIGQYIAPSKKHAKVIEYINPEQFIEYKHIGEQMGIPYVFSEPLVRSSYHAAEIQMKL